MQRLARRCKFESRDTDNLELLEFTQLAERTITDVRHTAFCTFACFKPGSPLDKLATARPAVAYGINRRRSDLH